MFKCRYCESVFPTLGTRGTCPNCGGPGLKQVDPEVVTKYVYVSDYYVPPVTYNPVRFTRRWAYNTFGYRFVTAMLFVLLVVVVGSFVYWLSYRAPRAPQPDRLALPTAVSTPTNVPDTNSWRDEKWLDAKETRLLREKENVINLAYLDRGEAKYSKEHSFVWYPENPWVQTRPLGVTELTVSGTSAQIKAGGYAYTINALQPFVLASQPSKVNVVDVTGNVWQADLALLSIASLDDVVSGLSITIAPNPNLSVTY